MRLLFVDDESKVLDGIKRALFALDEEDWEAVFETSAQDGLARLAAESFDVVVSDMRMPKMDGANFLAEVNKLYPHIIRIVLSGQSEEEAALRAAQVAHQFLSKPCKLEVLRDLILHITQMRQRVEREQVRTLVSGLEHLPPIPKVLQQLGALLNEQDPNLKQIVATAQQDLSISAKLMQLGNSSFFCRGGWTSDLSVSVQRLGLRLLRQIVLSETIFGSIKDQEAGPLDLESAQQEATLRMSLVSRFLNSPRAKEIGTLAAMVCDIGKLVMSSRAPHLYRQVIAARREGAQEHDAELSHFGCTHAEIGAYLLALWSLPPPVAEVVTYHHDLPTQGTKELKEIAAAVHLASCLVEKTQPNEEWFLANGFRDALKQWSDLAKTQ
jgi:HD-like signal output (HDOD) protein